MIEFRLKKGKEKSILHGHPWVFTGAIASATGEAKRGDLVQVLSLDGEFLAIGQYSPSGSILIRLMERDESVPVDENWIRRNIRRAISLRAHIPKETTTAMRLIFAESDFLPGVIVDRFSDLLAFQASSWWAETNKTVIAKILLEETGARSVIERGDGDARKQEGLPEHFALLAGDEIKERVVFKENGFEYEMDPTGGQKTGFYLDQRENRSTLEGYASGKNALDCFSYTGAISLALLRGGAKSVTALDSSSAALELLRANAKRNGYTTGLTVEEADVFEKLRQYRDEGKRFDLIVLDPPKLAPNKKSLDRALRAYKDLNLLGMKLLNPGGLLATFSCSGAVSSQDFRTMLGWASVDAKRDAQILHRFSQGEDHPVRLGFPEAEYLKGYLLAVE